MMQLWKGFLDAGPRNMMWHKQIQLLQGIDMNELSFLRKLTYTFEMEENWILF